MKKILTTLVLFQITFAFAQIDTLTLCEQAQLNATGLIGEFVPECEDDGSFASTQCWGSTGYCWCVDEYGVEISGTSIPSWQGMPDCGSTIDACTLIPDPGMCMAAIQKYFFNQETQQCEDFIWGGCGGVVPFESLAECEAALCAQPEDNCCINPAWINPNAMCGMIWDPVTGCDGIEYSNSCVAQASGVSSWTDQSGIETVLNWDCGEDLSYCDSISLNSILPLAGVWDDSVLVVNIETYFSNYSIPYAGLMLIDAMGDTIAMETMSTSGNVYEIGSNMFEERVLLLVNELVFPFTGELCVVEGLFAGEPNVVCSYPVMWQYVGLTQIEKESESKLIKMLDVLGREQSFHQKGQLLFYIYDNGFVEKLIKY